ncbi:hypothetical protein M422DRAFT_264311 [Sphaerobolus stellatus SS14]|uniref:Uncharacterized protein n=1 Tax=Sphaerobolus stellatus (strain SS14) TaxID=990650 RepID=A0A0C9TTL9_SPHS4|nr:hypothetical protein M422DRAFT_264311 [Sphaerobolus stellatus SS14]
MDENTLDILLANTSKDNVDEYIRLNRKLKTDIDLGCAKQQDIFESGWNLKKSVSPATVSILNSSGDEEIGFRMRGILVDLDLPPIYKYLSHRFYALKVTADPMIDPRNLLETCDPNYVHTEQNVVRFYMQETPGTDKHDKVMLENDIECNTANIDGELQDSKECSSGSIEQLSFTEVSPTVFSIGQMVEIQATFYLKRDHRTHKWFMLPTLRSICLLDSSIEQEILSKQINAMHHSPANYKPKVSVKCVMGMEEAEERDIGEARSTFKRMHL